VAGGVTSFMEMPNTVPQAITLELLEEKYKILRQKNPWPIIPFTLVQPMIILRKS
jgi:dihydroorotase-like cyclic amidohydrolase